MESLLTNWMWWTHSSLPLNFPLNSFSPTNGDWLAAATRKTITTQHNISFSVSDLHNAPYQSCKAGHQRDNIDDHYILCAWENVMLRSSLKFGRKNRLCSGFVTLTVYWFILFLYPILISIWNFLNPESKRIPRKWCDEGGNVIARN